MRTSKIVMALWAVLATVSASAQNMAKNGSFESEAKLSMFSNPATLKEKGFTVESDENRWANGWVINIGTKPAAFSVVDAPDAPDGKRYLKVSSTGLTHMYDINTTPGNAAYKISFSAKGAAFQEKPAVVKVHLYTYKKEGGAWAGKNILLGSFDLEEAWKVFSLDAAAIGDDLTFRLAFEFQGTCCLDNIKIEEKK